MLDLLTKLERVARRDVVWIEICLATGDCGEMS